MINVTSAIMLLVQNIPLQAHTILCLKASIIYSVRVRGRRGNWSVFWISGAVFIILMYRIPERPVCMRCVK